MDIIYNLDKKSRYCQDEEILYLSVWYLVRHSKSFVLENPVSVISGYDNLRLGEKRKADSALLTFYHFKELLSAFEKEPIKLSKLLVVFMQATTLPESSEVHIARANDDLFLAGYYDCANARILLKPKPGLHKVLFDASPTHKPLVKDLYANRIRIVPNTTILGYTSIIKE